jgi:hypothetical protein
MASVVARTLMAVGDATVLAAGSAHAANVSWSVGIQAPIAPGVSVGTVISNQYGYPVSAPVIVAPPVYVPPPVVIAQPVYAPPIYTPRVVYGAPVWVGGRWVRYQVPHSHAGVWHPGFDHRVQPLPVRMPGREIRY